MRLIDADIIQDELATLILYVAGTPEGECVEYAHNLIDAQPTIDAVPVVHAHWVPQRPNNRTGKAYIFVCSNCKKFAIKSMPSSIDEMGYVFCPYCGAEMDEVEE